LLKCWGFLTTTLSLEHISDVVFPRYIGVFTELLKEEYLPVREAAGQNIALLIECQRNVDLEAFDINNYDGYLSVDDLLNKIEELSLENTRYKAKKERLMQRSMFKPIRATIENGISPQEILSFKHQKISFEGWSEILQLNFFRHCLAIGFQNHVVYNDLFEEIFDMQLDKSKINNNMTAVQKRMIKSPNSALAKARTRNRTKQRIIRTTLTTNGDDD